MKKFLKLFLNVAFLIAPASLATKGFASPRLIRDNRILDLGISPTLGRGYSLTNNTIQSLCFKTVSKTTPTYDLEYEFEEIDETYMNKTSLDIRLENAFLHSFLKKYTTFSEKVTEGTTTKSVRVKNILARIKVASYYHSLDEAQSGMSDAAKMLLTRGDLISFFDSCGYYYIRSLGRHSTFMVLFKYRMEDNDTDETFYNNFHKRIFSFQATQPADAKFEQEVQKRVLRINLQAIGLGKGEIVNLLPTNINDYRKTIENAVKLMQDPNSGSITSMEVAPWTELAEFQVNLLTQGENQTLRFVEQKNIEENSSVLSEIDRIDRYQMDMYYKAFNCQRILKEEFPVGTGQFEYDPKKTFFYDLANKANSANNKSLEELLGVINQKSLDTMYQDNAKFIYGTSAGTKDGALFCLNQLQTQDIAKVNYRNIPACVAAFQYPVKLYPLIDHYCLPEQVQVPVVIRPVLPHPIPTFRPGPIGPSP